MRSGGTPLRASRWVAWAPLPGPTNVLGGSVGRLCFHVFPGLSMVALARGDVCSPARKGRATGVDGW